MTSPRVLLPAAVVIGCLALAAGCGSGEQPPEPTAPAAEVPESDARAAGGAVGSESVADDFAPFDQGSCSAPFSPEGQAPEGVTIEGWATATFTAADDEPLVIAALTSEIGIAENDIDCFFSDGTTPDDIAAEDAAAPGAPEPAAAPEVAPGAEPVGFGFCSADWQPQLPTGSLPDGASIGLNANASFGPKMLLAPARRALAAASGRPAASIECSHEIPPVGECVVELGPGGDGLPAGARVEGNVYGTYIRPADKARVKAAVTKLSGVPASRVRCMDFEAIGDGDEEPIPVEPGDAPATSGP